MNPCFISPYVRIAKRLNVVNPSAIGTRILLDYELLLLEQGEFLLTFPDKTYHCQAPALVMICPNIIHGFKGLGSAIEEPHIHFDMVYDEYSESFSGARRPGQLTSTELSIMRPNIFAGSPLLSPVLNVTDIASLRVMFYDIIDTMQAKNFLYEIELKQKMTALLLFLFRDCLPFCFENRINSDTIAYKIKRYIDENFTEVITLKSLASEFHYNPCYLTTIFLKTFNTTLMAYYRDKRLTLAKSMLLDGCSVGEAANRLRFSSIYAFSRFFKDSAGCPPTAYVAEHKHNLTN